MIGVRQTARFAKWLDALRDRKAQVIVAARIVRVYSGLLGDAEFFDGIGELRIDFGPGYRVYFAQRGRTLIILLSGGEKSSQEGRHQEGDTTGKEL